MISIFNVDFSYKKRSFFKKKRSVKKIFQGLNLELKAGKIFGLIGPNGSGKTTFTKLIIGLYPLDQGSISYQNVDIKTYPRYREKIGFLSGAATKLFSTINIQEQYDFYRHLYPQFNRELFYKIVEEGKLSNKLNSFSYELSFGERIQFEVGLTLAVQPSILILDEPTVGLDIIVIERIRKLIIDYTVENKVITILTSHNLNDIALMSNYGGFLYQFKIRQVFPQWTDKEQELRKKYKVLFGTKKE